MTQEELATAAGAERVAPARIEHGAQSARYETMAAGADVTFTDMPEHFSSDYVIIKQEGKLQC